MGVNRGLVVQEGYQSSAHLIVGQLRTVWVDRTVVDGSHSSGEFIQLVLYAVAYSIVV